MNSILYLTLLFVAFSAATTENFRTNNRQVYASWTVCDTCKCQYFSLYAFEYATQNPSDTTPPHYLYYSHSDYDYCLNTYLSDWLQITNNLEGLAISQSGRTAELVITNVPDSSSHNVSMSLNWSTDDSQNTNNCNCQNVYSYGVESFRVTSRSNYRFGQLSGSVTINDQVHTVPTDAYSYISGYGQKMIVLKHH